MQNKFVPFETNLFSFLMYWKYGLIIQNYSAMHLSVATQQTFSQVNQSEICKRNNSNLILSLIYTDISQKIKLSQAAYRILIYPKKI